MRNLLFGIHALLACVGLFSPANAIAQTVVADSATTSAATAMPSVSASAAPRDSAQLDAIAKVSERAIAAASASVDQIKWIFSVASLVISGLIAVLGFLGYQNVRSISAGIRDEARIRIDKELGEFNRTVRSAAKLALRTQAAMRQVYLAEK